MQEAILKAATGTEQGLSTSKLQALAPSQQPRRGLRRGTLLLLDGRTVQSVLRADRDTFVIPSRPDPMQVLRAYLDMGARHIFSGLDHLLFVFGLVLLVASGARYGSRLLLTLSAFTVGHCRRGPASS